MAKTEPKVGYGRADYAQNGALYRVWQVVKKGLPRGTVTILNRPVAIVPRARYRALLAAERERDALRNAWPKGCYAEMLAALGTPAPLRGKGGK